MKEGSYPALEGGTECLIKWVLSDYEAKALETFSRRTRVSWNEPGHLPDCDTKIEELYLIYAPTTTDNSVSWLLTRDGFQRKDSNVTAFYSTRDSPGSIDRDWKGEMDSWIRKCIYTCYSNHSGRLECHVEEPEKSLSDDERFHELIRMPWFRVIDIKGMKLAGLPSENGLHEPYVALGYRWSTTDHMTSPSNPHRRESETEVSI